MNLKVLSLFCALFTIYHKETHSADKKYTPFLKLDLKDIYNSPINQSPLPARKPVLAIHNAAIPPHQSFPYISITFENQPPRYFIDQKILTLALTILKIAHNYETYQSSSSFIRQHNKKPISRPLEPIFSIQNILSPCCNQQNLSLPVNNSPILIDYGTLTLIFAITKLATNIATNSAQKLPLQKNSSYPLPWIKKIHTPRKKRLPPIENSVSIIKKNMAKDRFKFFIENPPK